MEESLVGRPLDLISFAMRPSSFPTIKPHKADDFVVFIFGIENGAEEIRTEIESFPRSSF
jgi:hypothetical protein